MRRWWMLAAAALLVPLATAQSADAPPLGPAQATLYVHGTGSDEANGFMNTLEQDGGDNAMGPSGSCTTGTGVGPIDDVVNPPQDLDRTYTFTMDPPVAGTVTLDTAAQAEFILHLGAGSCHSDDVQVSVEISLDGTTVLAAGPVSHSFEAGAPYAAVTLTATPQTAMIGPGELVWTVTLGGEWNGALFLGMSAEQGRSRVTLPVLSGGAPEPSVTALNGTTAAIDLEWNASSESATYLWDGPADAQELSITGELAGNATVVVRDGADAELFSMRLGGPIAVDETLTGANGTWSILVTAHNATGDLHIQIGPPAAGGTETTGAPGTSTGTADEGTATQTDGNEEDGGQDSPGIGILLVLALLAVAARRR